MPTGDAKILVVFGTRPEAIKMFPVVHALRERPGLKVEVAITAQHRQLLDQVLEFAAIRPDVDLDLMEPGQTLDDLTARIIVEFGRVLDATKPDRVCVHGDTLTTMVAALAAYYRKIPVAHIEAGLRSGDIYSPWPEEINRKITGTIADLHFAPTQAAADALMAENVLPGSIHVTGNTVIDALLIARKRIADEPQLAPVAADLKARFEGKKVVLATAHRRENFGAGMQQIAAALAKLADREDVAVVFPVHPNPNVTKVMLPALSHLENVALVEPMGYLDFVGTLAMSHVVLTDSGGVQEEAPSLGKPVLVLRNTTERPEGIEAGTGLLVGTGTNAILRETSWLLDNPDAYAKMSRAHNPYGDGTASATIANIIAATHCP